MSAGVTVTVNQADREAAADCYLALEGPPYSTRDIERAENHRAGKYDTFAIVQAFARHRHEAETASKTEIEGLRSYIVECDENALAERNALRGALAAIIADPDCCAASKAIARAGLGVRND